MAANTPVKSWQAEAVLNVIAQTTGINYSVANVDVMIFSDEEAHK